MNDNSLIMVISQLTQELSRQREMQEGLMASNRALTEMLAHTIDAVKELTEQMAPASPEVDMGDDIQF